MLDICGCGLAVFILQQYHLVKFALMESSSFFLAIFLLFSLFLLLLLLNPYGPQRKNNLPPGPTPWPIVGNLLHLGRAQPHTDLAHLAQAHGPLFTLRLGSNLAVVASTSAAAEQVLKAHDRAFSGRHVVHVARSQGYTEHSHVWSVDCGEHWRSTRRIFRTSLIGPRMMEAQAHSRERKVFDMVSLVKEREGEVVEVGEVVFGTILDLFGELVFSTDLSRCRGDYDIKAQFCRLMELSGAMSVEDYFPVLAKFDLFGRRRAADGLRSKVYGSWKGFIAERRDRRRRRNDDDFPVAQDFLNVLIDAGMSDEQINVLLLDIFVAGTETSASTVEWAMAELIKNPETMKKLHQELKTEIGEGPVRESHLPHLPYLQSIVKETLRLHPPAPLLPHLALESCDLMGYTIPKGCQVIVNVWAIGRDPQIWEDPLKFSPERFIDSSLDYKENDFSFIPFGGGRRSCPGICLATLLVPFILASLLHKFEWRLPIGMQIEQLTMGEKLGLTIQMDPPLLLIPTSLDPRKVG